jgi:hypothetical protein
VITGNYLHVSYLENVRIVSTLRPMTVLVVLHGIGSPTHLQWNVYLNFAMHSSTHALQLSVDYVNIQNAQIQCVPTEDV